MQMACPHIGGLQDAVKIYRPFARQQEAIDFAAQCNAALSQNDRTLSVGEADAVKVKSPSLDWATPSGVQPGVQKYSCF